MDIEKKNFIVSKLKDRIQEHDDNYNFHKAKKLGSYLEIILSQQQEIERLKGEGWISVDDECPAVGQLVILFSNGVVQKEIYMFDMTDTSDYGGMSYFWSRGGLDECPEIKDCDMWQSLPKAPKERTVRP